jgi:hypothetical protein
MNHLRVLPSGGVRLDSDPRRRDFQAWNREWTALQQRGTAFRTETASVDLVNPTSTHGTRFFIGGSRTFSDRFAVAERLSQLPWDAIVLTSPTYGASAAVRDVVLDQGLQMEVWTAQVDRFPTREAAYFARDEEMIRSADRVIAFWDGSSSGTAHELEYARQIGKPVELLNAFEEPPTSAREARIGRHRVRLPRDRRGAPSSRPPERHPGGDAA